MKIGGRQFRQITEIARGSGFAFVLKVGGSALSFLLSIVLAKKLGVNGAGTYFLAFTVTTLVATFSRLGLDHAVVRFTAVCRAKDDFASISYLARTALAITFLLSFAAATVLFLLAPWLANTVFNNSILVVPLKLMSFGIVFYSLTFIMVQLLKGVGHVRDSQLLEVLLMPALMIPGVWLLANSLGVNSAPAAFVISTIATAAIGLMLSAKLWRKPPSDKPEVSRSVLLGTSVTLMGITTVNLMTIAAAPLILGYFAAVDDVAIYTAASKAAFLTAILLASVSTISGPKFSALYARSQMRQLERSVRQINLLLGVIAAPLLFGYILFSEEIMSLYGADFSAGVPVLIILSIGQYVSLCSGSVGQLLMMCGQQKASLKIMVVVSIMNLALNVTLVPIWGVVGAAIATSVTLVGKNLIAVFAVNRLLGIAVLPLMRRRAS